MQLLIVFATIFAASFASPYGEVNQAVQTSNALAGGDAGRGVEGLGLGAINKAQQTSNALAGNNGVAVASGTANAGNRLVKRAADEVPKIPTEADKKPAPKIKRAVAMIIGGPKAGEYIAI